MIRKRNILFIILFISSLSLIFTPKTVEGSIADIHYTFKNDVLFSESNPSFNSTFNIRNPYEYTESYNSSYFIDSDSVGLDPIGWLDGSTITCTAETYGNIDGHNSTLRLVDSDGGISLATNDFTLDTQDYGTIEYWFRTTDITIASYFKLFDGGTQIMTVMISGSNWLYNFAPIIPNVNPPVNNQWFHILIHFELTGGGYKGLAQYRMEVIINEISSGSLVLLNNENEVSSTTFNTNSAHNGYTTYIDAIGYSRLSNYTISQNSLPIIETDTSFEVDKFEFANDGINSLYGIGVSNPDGWTDIELPSGNQVYVGAGTDPNDRNVVSVANVGGDSRGIEKLFDVDGEFINISVNVAFPTLGGIANDFYIEIQSKDTADITILSVEASGDLQYWDGGWTVLRNDIVIETYYTFDIFLNYEIDRVFLVYSVEGIIIEQYNYPMIGLAKQGLSEVKIYTFSVDANSISTIIDYVGVYNDGSSLSTSFGWTSTLLGNDWSYENNNLFTINGSGTFYTGAVSSSYQVGESMYIIRDTEIYTNNTLFLNLYDDYVANLINANLILTLTGKDFFLNSLNIEGAKLIEGVNEYFLEYSHSGIETNDSYFYVDNDNKLQFTLITNDTDTEYIQGTFDIPNVDSTEKAISFKGFRLNKAYGYFVVDYLAGITIVDIPLIEKTTRGILPSNKTIDTFVILITDNDVDTILGTTTGYVSYPSLLSIVGGTLPIISAGLIEMFIPLIMILIPTLLISKGFGKEGKKLIIPLFLVFSIIATITLTIPVWIFFVIAFGTGLFLFRNKEIESET